jgi:O-antigen/teichoic acid export membrane protein
MARVASSVNAAALTAVTSTEALAPAATNAAEPRRLSINFLFLSCGESTAKLLTFASFSYLARTLGPVNYGFVEFTLAVMVFFTMPADLGLGSYGAREIARNPDRASRLLHEITGLRMVLTLCSMAGLAIFILLVHKSLELKLLLVLYGVSLLGCPFLLQWFFQAHDRMQWVGAASIVRQLGFAALVFAMCRRGSPLFYIGMIECASVAAVVAFCVYVARKRMGFALQSPDLHVTRLLGHLREAAPIGLTDLAWAFMWYFCTVLLGFVFADRTLGWFGASHRALMALHTFVWLYFFNLLPSISRCVARPHAELLTLMDGSVRFASWTGLFVAAGLTAGAPEVLTTIYGASFRPAAQSLAILAWMLPVAMLSGHHRFALIAYSQQKRLLYCTTISALAAVVLGFALVPFYGGIGAAWALLLANILNFVLVYFAVRKVIVEVPIGRQLGAPLAVLAVSALGYFLLLIKWNVWIALTGGAAIYLTGLAVLDGPRLLAFARIFANRPDARTL